MKLPERDSGIFGQALHPGDIEDGHGGSADELRRLSDVDELEAFQAMEVNKVRRFSGVQDEHRERGGMGNRVWPGDL